MTPDTHETAPLQVGGEQQQPSRTRRGAVLACIMMGVFITAIEWTIVATAMPQIVGALGGFALYSWTFAGFLVTLAAMTMIFGRLADMYGRKPILIAGIAAFLIGSLLCGLAWSMTALIAFRILQGIGAGAIQPVSMTLASDLYPGAQRAAIQGYLSAVWTVAALLGPVAGGLIVQHLTWHWVFWINIPVGIATIIGLLLYLDERVERHDHAIDYAGAAFFMISIVSLLLLVIQGGTAWPWFSLQSLVLAATAIGCFALFLRHEKRVAEPMVDITLWRDQPLAPLNATMVFAGMVLAGLVTFVPPYVQTVMGQSAVIAGFTITTFSVGWTVSAMGVRWIGVYLGGAGQARLAALMLVAGAAVLCTVEPASSPYILPGLGSLLLGAGLGLLNVTLILLINESTDWDRRGSATSASVFSRMLGTALGAAALGSLLNQTLALRLGTGQDGVALVSPEAFRALLDHSAGVAGESQAVLLAALDEGLRHTFWATLALAIATLAVTFFVRARGR